MDKLKFLYFDIMKMQRKVKINLPNPSISSGGPSVKVIIVKGWSFDCSKFHIT